MAVQVGFDKMPTLAEFVSPRPSKPKTRKQIEAGIRSWLGASAVTGRPAEGG